MKHFGIEVSNYDKLSKTKYTNYIKESDLKKYTKKEIMQNYDNNMQYFEKLSKEEFNLSLDKFLKKYKNFNQIYNLEECNFSGFYLMILDKYKQVYIGVANNIKKRIIEHWNKSPINLVYGKSTDSKLCIDSFRALDTTRLYVIEKHYDYDMQLINKLMLESHPEYKPLPLMHFLEMDEAEMINKFNSKFTCNRYIRYDIKPFRRNFNISS